MQIQSSTGPQDINNKLLNEIKHVQNQTLDKLNESSRSISEALAQKY